MVTEKDKQMLDILADAVAISKKETQFTDMMNRLGITKL